MKGNEDRYYPDVEEMRANNKMNSRPNNFKLVVFGASK